MCNPQNFADVIDGRAHGRTQKMPEKCRRTIKDDARALFVVIRF